MKTYLDIVMSDEKDAMEFEGTKDHNWVGLKATMEGPRMSWFELYMLKRNLEKFYKKLNEHDYNTSTEVIPQQDAKK